MSPDQSNEELLCIAEILKPYPKVYINAGNTTKRTIDQLNVNSSQFSRPVGGLSGASLYQRTKEMVELLKPTKIPIIATGGIDSFEKADELLELGASLIGLATGLVINPFIIPQINEKLAIKNKKIKR